MLQDQCRVLEGAGQGGGARALRGGSDGLEAAALAPPSPIERWVPRSQEESRVEGGDSRWKAAPPSEINTDPGWRSVEFLSAGAAAGRAACPPPRHSSPPLLCQ